MQWWGILLITIAIIIALLLLVPILIGLVYRCTQRKAPVSRLDGKTIIVTGASAGIGMESTLALARMGPRIIMACRNLTKAQPVADDIITKSGNNNIVVKHLDLSDLESVRKFAAEINEEEPQLHVLLNNAGIMLEGDKRQSPQGLELVMATNHYGPFLLTNLLIGKLKESAPSRIVTLSSSAHEIDELEVDDLNYETRPYGAFRCYGQSKLCNLLFAKELARRLEGANVASYSLHPGLVNSELFNKDDGIILKMSNLLVKVIARTQEQGAQTSIYLCVADEIEGNPGDYFVNCRPQTVKKKAADMNLAEKLWEVSARDVQLTEAEAASPTK